MRTIALLITLLFASSASADTIHACVSKKGKIKIVAEGTVCKKKATAISWGVTGPVGEAGPQGEMGPPWIG